MTPMALGPSAADVAPPSPPAAPAPMPAAANVGRFSGDESAVERPIPASDRGRHDGPAGELGHDHLRALRHADRPVREDLGEPRTARLGRGAGLARD